VGWVKFLTHVSLPFTTDGSAGPDLPTGTINLPSAAVRQRSIADITFICWRLTCPALALPPRRPVVAEDVRDLQRWTEHDG
jgi:hypothetical protein